jgi:hypothetical protein
VAGGHDHHPRATLRVNLGTLPEYLVPTSTIQISSDGRGGW